MVAKNGFNVIWTDKRRPGHGVEVVLFIHTRWFLLRWRVRVNLHTKMVFWGGSFWTRAQIASGRLTKPSHRFQIPFMKRRDDVAVDWTNVTHR